MYFSTAVVAAFAATYVSASPLMVRGNTCGTAPVGTNSNNQPIAQPSGIQTSAACQSQCEAESSCKSFCFGMVDNTVQCKLYSCAASAVPTQSSTNLVVYDKACSAVPSVVPTSSNPTGKEVDNGQSNTNSGSQTSQQMAQQSKQSVASKTSEQEAQQSKQADASKTSDQKAKQSSNTYGTQKSTQKQSSNTNTEKQSSDTNNQKESSSTDTQKEGSSNTNTSANTCGVKPTASTNNQPISTPSVTSEDACKTNCEADSSCKSFTCGQVNSKFVCKLYAVAAAQLPAPSNAAEKSAIKAFDVGCSI